MTRWREKFDRKSECKVSRNHPYGYVDHLCGSSRPVTVYGRRFCGLRSQLRFYVARGGGTRGHFRCTWSFLVHETHRDGSRKAKTVHVNRLCLREPDKRFA